MFSVETKFGFKPLIKSKSFVKPVLFLNGPKRIGKKISIYFQKGFETNRATWLQHQKCCRIVKCEK